MRRWGLAAALALMTATCVDYSRTGLDECFASQTRYCTCPGALNSGMQTCADTPTGSRYGQCSCPAACRINDTRICTCGGPRLTVGSQACVESPQGPRYEACVCPDAGTSSQTDASMPAVPDAGNPSMVPLVTINVRSAVVGIAQFPSQEEWDSNSRVVPGLLSLFGDILGTAPNPYAQVAGRLLSFLGGVDFSHYDKPDPYGTASIFSGGRWQLEQPLSTRENNTHNTFVPSWMGGDGSGRVGWIHVPLAGDLRVRVRVFDEDVSKDDPIGDVEIGTNEIRAALEAGNIYFVRTAESSQNQLLFVGISVARE